MSRTPEDLARDVRAVGVEDERVLEAIRATPRAGFVPAEAIGLAYDDVPIPVAHGQVTTQPSLSAVMIGALELDGTEHVLEVGTGLGFQTALLARLAGDVVSVERQSDLLDQARRNLERAGFTEVDLRVGDGSCGVPDRAPYDAVLVSAAFPAVPVPLTAQLRIGGRLVQPIGPGGQDEVVLFERRPEGLRRSRMLTFASFVRLHGRYGYP